MGRALRTDVADHVYHVLNRANARATLFSNTSDYQLFEDVLAAAKERVDMRILAYSIMPNHWHFVLHPRTDGDLARFVNWLTLTHTQRSHAMHNTIGHGHIYQGRYKSFLCEADPHFLQLVRYVERNPLRAGLVARAEEWRWGSAWRRTNGTVQQKKLLNDWPVPLPAQYSDILNTPQSEEEVAAMRRSVLRGSPYGSDRWSEQMIATFKLEATVRARGRPIKGS